MSYYTASYWQANTGLKQIDFENKEDITRYNSAEGIKHHNLHFTCTLDELINKRDGLIICIEGDDDLYDEELSTLLHKLPNFIMYNNIYDCPEKLSMLKGTSVIALIVQSTGVRYKELQEIQKQYIDNIGVFPENLICVLGDEDTFLKPLTKAAPEMKIFSIKGTSIDSINLTQWIGTNKDV